MSIVKIRKLQPDDGLAAGHVFFDAIHKGTVADYSAPERDAWAGQTVDYQRWENRLVGQNGFAAVEDDEPIGFMTLNLDGFIELAFVRSDRIGQGIGTALFGAVEAEANTKRIAKLETEASITARPFFARFGFGVECEQSIPKNGQMLTNFKMRKDLKNPI